MEVLSHFYVDSFVFRSDRVLNCLSLEITESPLSEVSVGISLNEK